MHTDTFRELLLNTAWHALLNTFRKRCQIRLFLMNQTKLKNQKN